MRSAGPGTSNRRWPPPCSPPPRTRSRKPLPGWSAQRNRWSRRSGRPGAALDEVQRRAVTHAAEHGVSVLTGAPGTGKSRTVAAIVEMCRTARIGMALAAPTGRAAKRLEELTGAEATTIHRLLGARGGPVGRRRPVRIHRGQPDRGQGRRHRRGIDAGRRTGRGPAVARCQDGTHLVIVGDPAQLPSIGPGGCWVT